MPNSRTSTSSHSYSRSRDRARRRVLTRTTAALTAAVLAVSTALISAQAAIAAPTTAAETSAPDRAAGSAATEPAGAEAGPLYDFVDLPTQSVAADGRAHLVVTHYRNSSTAARTVATQLLIAPAGTGAVLEAADVRLERLDRSTGHWEAVPLGSQTGTLYSAIPGTGRTLSPGDGLDTVARLTVAPKAATSTGQAMVQPRIVIFNSPAG